MTVFRYSAVPFNLPRVNIGTSGSHTLVIVWLFVPPQTSHFSKIYEPRSDKRDPLAKKSKVRYLKKKKDLAVVSNYKKN